VRFSFSNSGAYHRELFRCTSCGHYLSAHAMQAGALYEGDYVSATYRDEAGVRRTFERIVALPPERSDNKGRARRVGDFAASHFPPGRFAGRRPTVLDVGSGLCVFLHEMKKAGWEGTALDPDPRAARHARDVVGVAAVCGDFRRAGGLGRFDAVTFNKVLEHVEDPVAMLASAGDRLLEGGFVYVELPDGEAAMAEGPGREEFFIDHHHVFSLASAALLCARAGFSVRTLERLREPSTKFTLRAFLAR
jgi:SAM-dependent methyltransferase